MAVRRSLSWPDEKQGSGRADERLALTRLRGGEGGGVCHDLKMFVEPFAWRLGGPDWGRELEARHNGQLNHLLVKQASKFLRRPGLHDQLGNLVSQLT